MGRAWGTGRALEGKADEEGLLGVLRAGPAYCGHWGVELDEDGLPKDPAALARIAGENAPVRIGGKPGHEERRLWLLWVLANAVGELIVLWLTALVGAVVVLSEDAGTNALATLVPAAPSRLSSPQRAAKSC